MPSKRINVFVDLGETLIHTIGMAPYAGKETFELKGQEPDPEVEYADKPVKVKIDKEICYVVLRPGANYLLYRLREIGHVYMLTRASKSYAKAMNKAFNFGFDEDRIFDKEYVKNWKYKNPKIPKGDNVLIDDLDSYDNFEKINFIKKFGPAKYIRIDAFWGWKESGLTHMNIDSIIEDIKS